jgi:hypothetical protein
MFVSLSLNGVFNTIAEVVLTQTFYIAHSLYPVQKEGSRSFCNRLWYIMVPARKSRELHAVNRSKITNIQSIVPYK